MFSLDWPPKCQQLKFEVFMCSQKSEVDLNCYGYINYKGNTEVHTRVNLLMVFYGISKSVFMFMWLLHSVHLARRVLQLERQNTSLRRDLDRYKSQIGQISEEVKIHTHCSRSVPAQQQSLMG